MGYVKQNNHNMIVTCPVMKKELTSVERVPRYVEKKQQRVSGKILSVSVPSRSEYVSKYKRKLDSAN